MTQSLRRLYLSPQRRVLYFPRHFAIDLIGIPIAWDLFEKPNVESYPNQRRNSVHSVNESNIVDAAEAIQRYLAQRPNAAETVEGVAKWWLARQRYDESVVLAQEALEYLESRGQVVRFHLAGGRVMYRQIIRAWPLLP